MHVAVRELKDHLSEYLSRAAAGEEVIITSHGKPTARLVPLAAEDSETSAIDRLRAQPWIIPPRKSGPFFAHQPVTTTAPDQELMSDIVLGMRE